MRITLCILIALLSVASKGGEDPVEKTPLPAPAKDILDLSFEEMLSINIYSASKKIEKVSEVASAIYVITQEDIRRSGHTSVAEALRLAPGVNVAQINSHAWAISARGFQGPLANKLLVLIDGRSVYTPLYSGVYWDVQDTLLEDIERIEVIRGPGATVWGANAVNGVINIITKDAKDTQGGLVTASVGTVEQTNDAIRYGGSIGEKVKYRLFAKYHKRDELDLGTTGNAAHDSNNMGRGGVRFDITPSKTDKILVEGNIYKGMYEEKPSRVLLNPPFAARRTSDAHVSGGNVMARWNHTFSEASDLSLQMYYDRTQRDEQLLGQTIETIDLDFNHRIKVDRHEIIYGTGYRFIKENIDNSFSIQFRPDDGKFNLFSAFVQDDISVIPDTFSLTIGTKIEHNDFTGFEVQPSLKTLWLPAKNHTVWTSLSRAVRTSSPLETDLRANLVAGSIGPNDPPILFSLFPNRNIRSEAVIASEIGYRVQPHKRVSIDASVYYNLYDHLRSNEAGKAFVEATPLPLHVTVPIVQRPFVDAETYGGELALSWEPLSRLKFSATYSYLQMLLHSDRRVKAADSEIAEGQSPEHQFSVRAFVDLPHNLQFDTAVYFVDRLDAYDISSYTRVDARLGWRPLEKLDVSIGAQNLFREKHEEFGENNAILERNVYLKVTFKF